MKITIAHFRKFYSDFTNEKITMSRMVEMFNEIAEGKPEAPTILHTIVQILPLSSAQSKIKFGKDMSVFYIEGFATEPETTLYFPPISGKAMLHTFDGKLFSVVTNDASYFLFAENIEKIVLNYKQIK